MDLSAFSLSPDACDDYFLGCVIDATAPAGETADGTRTRTAAIVAMYRVYAPGDAVEAMIASHCIALTFVLNAALRDAGDVSLDPRTMTRTRSTAVSISKALHQWVSRYESTRVRKEARAAEARKAAVAQPMEEPPKAADQPVSEPPAPQVARPPRAAPVPVQSVARPPPRTGFAALASREAMLAEVAAIGAGAANGRAAVT